MGSTRYNPKGIDNNGIVANFFRILLDFILMYNKEVFCLFAIKQKGIKAKTKVYLKLDINISRFEKYIKIMQEMFNIQKVDYFNLLGINKGEEDVLIGICYKYQTILKKNNSTYFYQDFYVIVKEIDSKAVDKYI